MESISGWGRSFLSVFFPYNQCSRSTAIKVLNPFASPSNCSGGSVAGLFFISPGLFSCEEERCVKMFSTYKELRGGAGHCVRCRQEKVGQHLIKRKLTETVHQCRLVMKAFWIAKKQLMVGRLRPSKSQAGCLKTLEST